jgi:hypothetical protein
MKFTTNFYSDLTLISLEQQIQRVRKLIIQLEKI